MNTTVTLEDLASVLHKVGIYQQEINRIIKEQALESERRFRETERVIKEQALESERKSQETDRKFQETNRQLKELGKQIGGLGEKFGSFTEGMAFPSMQKVLTERFSMDVVAPRYLVRKNGDTLELDVFAYAKAPTQKAMIVEVKSHLREEHIAQLLQIITTAKDFLPEHKDKTFYGILAAVDAPLRLKKQLLQLGIYYAEVHDEVFELKVPKNFQPRGF